MSYVQVGSCPQCGAPIYSPSVWMSILPPPATHSCACFPQQTATTSHSITIGGSPRPVEVKPSDPT